MPQSVIARLESGRQGLSFTTISKIASALDKKSSLFKKYFSRYNLLRKTTQHHARNSSSNTNNCQYME